MDKKVKIGIAAGIIFLLVTTIVICILLKNNTYTVTFDSNGGSIVEKQIVKKGESAVKPLNPVKEGYEFDGWYLGNEKYYFTEAITDNIELKARWNKKTNIETVTVTFNTDGGSKISSVEIEKGSKLKKPTDPTKDGYTFVEWLLNNNSFNFDIEIINNITLTAKWEEVKEDEVTVTFNSNGGSSVANKVIKKGEKVSKPANPTRTGYTFNGWYLDNKSFNFNTSVEKDITLTAKWTKNQTSSSNNNSSQSQTPSKPQEVKKYTVTFNSNGGSSVATQTIVAGGKATKPADPKRDGYTFVNWTHNGGAYNFNSPVNGNVILVANWEKIPEPDVYTVSLELIKGEANIPERKAIVYKNGSVITATQLQNQNGELLGKYIQSLGAIRVNKAQYDLATSLKVKLSDGSVVSATKN